MNSDQWGGLYFVIGMLLILAWELAKVAVIGYLFYKLITWIF